MHYFEDPDGRKQTNEEKSAGRLQNYVLSTIWRATGAVLESLRKQSAEAAQRFGQMTDAVESALSPYFSLSSGCGYAGAGTTLPDGRYIFVSVHDSHYGISDDKIEIILCKSQYISEEDKGKSYKETHESTFKITAKPGKLDYNAVAMALRVIADSLDAHQPNKTSDMAAFAHMMARYNHDKKEVDMRQHWYCLHHSGEKCYLTEGEDGSGI
jgi:hypothetical protein